MKCTEQQFWIISPHERPASPGQRAGVVAADVAPDHAQPLLVTHPSVQNKIIEAMGHHGYGCLNFLDQSLRKIDILSGA